MKRLLFSFQGRLNRAPYWYVHLALAAIQFPIFGALFAIIVYPVMETRDMNAIQDAARTMNLICLLFAPFIWISLAVMVKRCHDRDKTGWFIFIMLVPLIGPIWLLIELGFLRGTTGPNRFGSDPLGY
ncbi:DUF805 domain-containing protein [Reyranella aquatilis]|uniref:DUF805 domain-containing protein n=1 Tax=Reyranella aquatilis TaxID=2035356 RepID=A0ABS8L5A2_9HYPH|nr:DUF805 domain-containing protein [Reyranella aquatilis]MCC8432976.1 DUF805 domain-containing protein [Reyranella aquatilis]